MSLLLSGRPVLSVLSTHGAFESYADLWEWAQKLQVQDASGNITRWGWDHIGTSWSGFPALGGVLDQGSHWWDEGAGQFTINTEEMANTIQTIYLDPVYTHGNRLPAVLPRAAL